MTFVDFVICHRRSSLRTLYSLTLTYFLKVKMWNVNISETVSASTKRHWINFPDFIFAIEWPHYENCPPGPWPTFWLSTIENVNISETVKAGAKCIWRQLWILKFALKNNIVKFVFYDIDLLFESNNIWNIIISETVKAITIIHRMTSIDFDIIVTIVLHDLYLLFKVKSLTREYLKHHRCCRKNECDGFYRFLYMPSTLRQ